MRKKNSVAEVQVQPLTLAEKVFTLDEQISFLTEQRDEAKAELLMNLQKQGVKSVKLNNGTTFIRTERQTLKITPGTQATAWLDEHYCWKPDTSKAMEILRRELKLPRFFKINRTEYLTIKR